MSPANHVRCGSRASSIPEQAPPPKISVSFPPPVGNLLPDSLFFFMIVPIWYASALLIANWVFWIFRRHASWRPLSSQIQVRPCTDAPAASLEFCFVNYTRSRALFFNLIRFFSATWIPFQPDGRSKPHVQSAVPSGNSPIQSCTADSSPVSSRCFVRWKLPAQPRLDLQGLWMPPGRLVRLYLDPCLGYPERPIYWFISSCVLAN